MKTPSHEERDLEQARSIQARHRKIRSEDYFERLGVSRDAAAAEIEESFLRLKDAFDPYGLPKTLEHLVPEAREVCEALWEAYQTIADTTLRAAYLEELERGATGGRLAATAVREVEEAVKLAQEGERHLEREEHELAEKAFEQANRFHPRAEYLAAQAWAIYRNPSRAAPLETVSALLMQAIHLDENCDRAYFQFGLVAKDRGDLATAARCFRQALKANPRHAEARRALDLLSAEREEAS